MKHLIPEQYVRLASTPATPPAGFVALYFKTDGILYQLNSSGTETAVASGGTPTKLKTVEIEMLHNYGSSGKFTLTDAGVGMTGGLHASTHVIATAANGAASSRGTDDFLWDSVVYSTKCSEGSLEVHWKASGKIQGYRRIILFVNNN